MCATKLFVKNCFLTIFGITIAVTINHDLYVIVYSIEILKKQIE